MKLSPSSKRHGFTLIELLAVIVIIFILAALIVGGMNFAKDKQAFEQAKIQIKLIENALEIYKQDHGEYPPAENANGLGTSNVLFKRLYWDGTKSNPPTKVYMPEFDPKSNSQLMVDGSDENAILVDPWGNEWRYRTGTVAQNPDFDLWSVGKDGATNPTVLDHPENKDDIRNF